MSKAKQELTKLFRQYFKKKKALHIADWVQKYIRLGSQSTHKGLYDLKRTPYFRQLYEDLENPAVKNVYLSKSAQVGASQLAANAILFYVCNKTLPIAMVFPSQGMSQQFLERCLEPSLESTAPLQEFRTGSKHDERRSEIAFSSCRVKILGGGSASKLSSNPIAFLIIDEASKLQESFTTEADPINLAIARTITFDETGDTKIYITSTPTLNGSCAITRYYKKGNACKYNVPCPHCDALQELVFEGLRFSHCKENGEYNLDRVLAETYYECCQCKKPILESHKLKLINAGKWIATNLKAPSDTKSYHISSLYSLSTKFGAVAREFLQSIGNKEAMQHFHNSWLGLAFTETKSAVSETIVDDLIKLSPKYMKGEIPSACKALVMGCDTQQTIFYYTVLAILENGTTALVDWGSCIEFADLYAVSQKQYRVKDTEEFMSVYGGFVDAGGTRSTIVYDGCINSGKVLVPIYGRVNAHGQTTHIKQSPIIYKNQNLNIIYVHHDLFTSEMMGNRLNLTGFQRMALPQDSDELLKKHLMAVSLRDVKNKFRQIEAVYFWKAEAHLLDCLKYAIACQYMIQPQLDQVEEVDVPENEAEEEEPYVNYGW